MLISFPVGRGQDEELIGQTFAEDWQLRPFEGPSGPGRDGVSSLASFATRLIPNLSYDRQLTLLCGDKAVVVSKVAGTVTTTPPPTRINLLQSILGIEPLGEEIPFFPGIPASDIGGKSFETIAIDVQRIRDGEIGQTWSVLDWASAVRQMVNNQPPTDLGFSRDFLTNV